MGHFQMIHWRIFLFLQLFLFQTDTACYVNSSCNCECSSQNNAYNYLGRVIRFLWIIGFEITIIVANTILIRISTSTSLTICKTYALLASKSTSVTGLACLVPIEGFNTKAAIRRNIITCFTNSACYCLISLVTYGAVASAARTSRTL